MISFLGTGLLGANFTRALIQKGEQVNVWNRTSEKAKALEQYGAKAYDNVADAVKGMKRIHLTLTDDAVVDAVLKEAEPSIEKGAIIIDHSTTSAQGAAKRSDYWKEKGIHFIHAPVFMGPPNALESTGTMLVSGDQQIIAELEPALSKMTGKLWNLGEDPSKAAAIKLLGNLLHICLTGAVSDMLALASTFHIDSSEIASLIEVLNPSVVAQGRLKKITSRTFDQPSWELSMARKDARLMMEQSERGGKNLMVVPAVAKRMDEWIGKGFGGSDWTVLSGY
jgi:3-hydroxyisobutyrate dehydrogenase